jgi:hypothetical protein
MIAWLLFIQTFSFAEMSCRKSFYITPYPLSFDLHVIELAIASCGEYLNLPFSSPVHIHSLQNREGLSTL